MDFLMVSALSAKSPDTLSLIITSGRLFSDFQCTRFSYANHLQDTFTLPGPVF
jgi:hypothetical protein